MLLEFPLVYPLTEHFEQMRALPYFYSPLWPWSWRQGVFAGLFHTEIMQPHELGAPVWYHQCSEVYQCQPPNCDTYCRSCLKAGCQQRLSACFRPHQSWGTFRGIGDDLVFRRARTRNSGLFSPARKGGQECQDHPLGMVVVGIPPCIPPD